MFCHPRTQEPVIPEAGQKIPTTRPSLAIVALCTCCEEDMAMMTTMATAEPWVAIVSTLPGIKTTTSGSHVVSLVVEIVSCNDLWSSKIPLADPYVKVKLAKPSNKKLFAMADIHKTKSLHQT
jgi:hypothetical protein